MIPPEILRKVRRLQIRTSHRVDEILAGSWHSAFKGHGMEFEEVRPYQIGDDVRAIDWNVSARSDQPFVKLFREERELSVRLLIDVSGSLDFGTTTQTKRELVTELAALISFSAIKNNDRVGLTLFTDGIEKHVASGQGSRHVLRMIRELLVHTSIGTGTDIAAAIDHLARTSRRRSVVFLISDFQADDFERPLRLARRRHDIVPVVVGDQREWTMPPMGLIRLRDAETGRVVTLDTTSARHRRAYEQMMRDRDAYLTSMWKRLRLRPLSIATGEDLVEPLQRYFHNHHAPGGS